MGVSKMYGFNGTAILLTDLNLNEMEKETKEKIIELINDMLINPKDISFFKDLVVKKQKYELAAQIREYETTHFPERHTQSEEKKFAEKYRLLMKMMDLDISLKNAFLMGRAIEENIKAGEKGLDLKTAAKIICRADEIFA